MLFPANRNERPITTSFKWRRNHFRWQRESYYNSILTKLLQFYRIHILTLPIYKYTLINYTPISICLLLNHNNNLLSVKDVWSEYPICLGKMVIISSELKWSVTHRTAYSRRFIEIPLWQGPVLHRYHTVVRSSPIHIGDDWGVEDPVRVEFLWTFRSKQFSE